MVEVGSAQNSTENACPNTLRTETEEEVRTELLEASNERVLVTHAGNTKISQDDTVTKGSTNCNGPAQGPPEGPGNRGSKHWQSVARVFTMGSVRGFTGAAVEEWAGHAVHSGKTPNVLTGQAAGTIVMRNKINTRWKHKKRMKTRKNGVRMHAVAYMPLPTLVLPEKQQDHMR